MAAIRLTGVVKRYDSQTIIHGLDLEIKDGEFMALVGPSGCGKSTTLRMIAGLEGVSEGILEIDGQVVNDLEPRDRDIAMVFQNYAIYPHRTVSQNIAFGLFASKMNKTEKNRRVREVACMLGLEELLGRRPSQLSGGQRQRVAIGRAMVRNPVAFLFDEPLSNLDAQLRAQMRIEIKRLHRTLGTTIVFVTHDQVEAMTMAERIAIMRDGYILQVGSPMELYETPVDVFTAKFIGTPAINLLPGRVTRNGTGKSVDLVDIGGIDLPEKSSGCAIETGVEVLMGMRPHDLKLVNEGEAGVDGPQFNGVVAEIEPLGSETLIHLKVGERLIVGHSSGPKLPRIGAAARLSLPWERLYFFDARSQKAFLRGI